MRKLIVCLCLLVASVVLSGPVYCEQIETPVKEPLLRIEANNKPFTEVADEIFKQSGYKIIFDEKWNTLPVSGKYSDVTIEEFFRRVFRKQNTSLLFDNQGKFVVVRFFGDKSFKELMSTSLADTSGNREQVPEEIAELHRQQHQELEDYLNDPESVDPMSGMKLVVIREMHDEQHAELEQMKNNPDTIEPTSGATVGELQQLQAAQQKENDQLRNNPETVEPESGMNVGAIAEMHRAQRAELERMLKDPDTVDPTSGMKLSEIWKLAKKPQ